MKFRLLAFNIILTGLLSIAGLAQAAVFAPPVRQVGPYLRNVMNFGAVGDGKHDDTAAIQKAIDSLPDSGGTVDIPKGTYLIDALTSVHLRSFLHFNMAPRAVLKTKTSGADKSVVLFAEGIHDVEISGGQIVGDRDTHTGTTGEAGHAIKISGSARVTIRDIKVSKNWGDGVDIGPFKANGGVSLSEDIVLYNVLSTENRRQGLSIGNSTDIKVYNSEFSYTNGTAPQYGIDIEPDRILIGTTDYHYVKNIEIVNCKIHHNQGGGIQFFRQTYNGSIRHNDISYNGFGIYAIEAFNSLITRNRIAHNRHIGLTLQEFTAGFEVSNNNVRNNDTNDYGLTNDTNPFVSVTGLSNPATVNQVGMSSKAGANKILTNNYAR